MIYDREFVFGTTIIADLKSSRYSVSRDVIRIYQKRYLVMKRNFLTYKNIFLVLFCLFLLRGSIQILMTPPLEGFDSIGHIDYLQYLHDHGKRDLKKMPMSENSLELLRLLPLCKHLETSDGSGLYYENYYTQSVSTIDSLKHVLWKMKFYPPNVTYVDSENNWQRKHPPLYYWILNAIVERIHPSYFIQAYYCFSFVSLLLLSLSMIPFYLFGKTISDTCNEKHKLFFVVLFTIQPMIYMIGARISNDALAYTFNALICLLLLKTLIASSEKKQTALMYALLAGTVTGLSIITKTYALLFLPSFFLIGIVAYIVNKNARYLFSTAVFSVIALCISLPTLLFHLKVTGQLDGNLIQSDLKNSGYAINYVKSFIDFYITSLDGYVQAVKIVTLRIWVGNWSSIANFPLVYIFYSVLYAVTLISFVRSLPSVVKKLYDPLTLFFVFSVILQGALFVALMKLGIETATYAQRVTAVAGYYSYAFYATELYIFWYLLKDKSFNWFAGISGLFLFTDITGILTQIIYYYGGGHVGPGRIIIPEYNWLSLIAGNWAHAPWQIISLKMFVVLCAVYFAFSTMMVLIVKNKGLDK